MATRKRGSTTTVGVERPLREEAVAATERAGLPVGEWGERMVPEEGPEPASPARVGLGELEAMVRRVVAEELRPIKEALARSGATAPSPPAGGGAQSNLMRMRMRRHGAR